MLSLRLYKMQRKELTKEETLTNPGAKHSLEH
jgi:hypothetical protein